VIVQGYLSQTVTVQVAGDTTYPASQTQTVILQGGGPAPPTSSETAIQLQASSLATQLGGSITFETTEGWDGTYNLYDGSKMVASVALSSGRQAFFSQTFLTPGAHLITAAYLGNAFRFGSVSNTITITVGTSAASAPPNSLTATPNPVVVPFGATVGATTITWSAPQAQAVELHIGSPNGILFSGGGSSGSAQTGPWVSDGMTFYLQDTTGGKSLVAANTLATLVVHVAQQAAQLSFSANPNPVSVPTGITAGATTLAWSAPQAGRVELHLGSPTGILFAAGTSAGSAQTGPWVTDGMTFYLQDTTSGKALTAANTLATLIVHVVQQAAQLSFSANPNPIPVVSGALLGSTLLQWDAPGAETVEIHVGSAAGILFAGGAPSGTAQTGQWVSDGMTFYLQDTSGGKALSAANTIATLVVHLQKQVLLSANPNPIPVAFGATVGATTISWNAPTGTLVEVHLTSPDGPLFAAGVSEGSAATGAWVSDGMTFYLQDVTGGKALAAANTLGTAVVHLQSQQASASLTANPNPIFISVGAHGSTTIAWDAPAAQTVEVHVGSPSGTLFAGGGPLGSAQTGLWVANGLVFYLQDTTGGKPLTSANTLATVTVAVQVQL